MFLSDYFIPIISVLENEYKFDEDNICKYMDSEAKRIKAKGCKVILVECEEKGNKKIMLVRKCERDENFTLTSSHYNIRSQYENIIKVMEKPTTKLIKKY